MIRQYVELVEERKKQVTTEKFPEASELQASARRFGQPMAVGA